MLLGTRQIRTSGKGSGSIELTLPADLRDLVGLPCRILLRDGSRPDIVLQPDLRGALHAFQALWQAAVQCLAEDRRHWPLPLDVFGFGLQPRFGQSDTPFLCWRDGLALSGPVPHDPFCVSRCLAAMCQAMAGELGIDDALAADFGAACGYLATGVHPGPEAQQACDLVAASLKGAARPGEAAPCLADPAGGGALGPGFLTMAGPQLRAARDLFLGWADDPAGLSLLRSAWKRGFSIDMNGG